MRKCVLFSVLVVSLFSGLSALATVNVSSPTNGSVVGSPVHFAGTASTTTCYKGVASMGVYIDDKLNYTVNGTSLNTSLPIGSGNHKTVIEEWDYCGGATYQIMNITVSGSTGGGNGLYNLQKTPWVGWGEYPPAYSICSSCGSGVTWSWNYGVTSPSLTGSATRFNMGGTHPYADVLFVNRVIGQGSTLVPDPGHTVLPKTHNFTYDVYFYTGSLNVAEVLEFDIAMYMNGKSYTWGNQCRILNGNAWDIWDNINNHWVPANVPCYPINNAWNHLTIQMQRTSNDQVLFQSITLNGKTATINRAYSPTTAPSSWYGVTLNFQMDGNSTQSPYSVYLDKLNLNYW